MAEVLDTSTYSGQFVGKGRRTYTYSSRFSGGRNASISKTIGLYKSASLVRRTAEVRSRIEGELSTSIKDEVFESLQNNLRLVLLSNIKLNLDILTEETENFLSNDNLLITALSQIVYMTKKCVSVKYGNYKLKLFLNNDPEIDLQELVLSVQIDEDNFDKRDLFWNELSNNAGGIINRLKELCISKEDYETAKSLVEIDNTIVLEVEELENV